MIAQLVDDDSVWVFWHEMTKGWTVSDHLASKYPRKVEAESRALQMVAEDSELLGKLQVKNFYGDSGDVAEQQLELF